MIESSGRDEEEVASDHDAEILLLPLHRKRTHRTLDVDDDQEAPFLPNFLRAVLPQVLQNLIQAVHLWLQGPRRPEKQHIKPLHIVPKWLQDKLSIKRQGLFVTAIFLVWAIFFFVVVWQWSLLPDIPDYGQPQRIRCMQQAWWVPRYAFAHMCLEY